ncbi:MAG: hypothetical protein K7J15_05165 [Candidatus Regiella insecticola]|nr:hypothetical protein [Candidatus Regiella insecticola]
MVQFIYIYIYTERERERERERMVQILKTPSNKCFIYVKQTTKS